MDSSALSDILRRSIAKIDGLEKRLSDLSSHIAIVGLSCRFPGAADVDGYWRLLSEGGTGVGEGGGDRWDIDSYYDPDPDALGKVYTRRAGLLTDIAGFDPSFFSISPREATTIDPQQRLVLEASWHALESAGISGNAFRDSRTGVYIGVGPNEYANLDRRNDVTLINGYSATGSHISVIAGRISYALGLQGPAVAVDTACSSSLVAVDLACDALRLGKADLVLAGGVNTVLSISGMLATCRARMLSPDGLCKTFDASADGYVRGEGCGMVVLKRLADAERDGDRILAVIRGSAVNQDGASAGLTVPNGPAQQRVIGEALERAGVLPHEVDYLEAHGTGTALGDPIEVRAAAAAYGVGRRADHPLLIGSVKTNIGHLEAAAGIAGLIKAVLALQHGVVPKHLNFVTPSPRIDWAGLPVKVTSEATPLPTGLDRPWRIGVSSFGFSGTNAHVILESYERNAVSAAGEQPGGVGPRRVRVLALSGKVPGVLPDLAEHWGQWLAARQSDGLTEEVLAQLLADASFTAGVGRNHFNHRAAIPFTGYDELAAGFAALAGADEAACAVGRVAGVVTGVRHPSAGAARIGFLFTGQGSQWAGMGLALYKSEPVFRAVLERCEAVALEVRGVSLLDVMFAREGTAGSLDDTQWTQPGLYALQAGLVALWASLGVRPAAVLGHSVGEIAAAHAAGVLSLEDGLQLALARGALMGALPAEGAGAGAMLAVFAPPERVARVLAGYPEISLAAENGNHRVVSGPVGQVLALADELTADGVRCDRLRTSHAFHSQLMDPMLDDLARVAERLSARAASVAIVSNVTGRVVGPETRLDGAYWRAHARAPVAFAQGVASLAELGVDCLLEVGPHGVLTAMAGLSWPGSERPRLVASLSRGEDAAASYAKAICNLYAAGAQLDFPALFTGEKRSRIAVPAYPFQRQRYWLETGTARAVDRNAGFLLGTAVDVVANGQRIYPQRISLGRQPWLADHSVYGVAVIPGMSYVAMALQAIGVPARIEAVNFTEPLFPPAEKAGERELQLVVTPAEEGKPGHFEVMSRSALTTDEPWRRHANGEFSLTTEYADASRRFDLEALKKQAQDFPSSRVDELGEMIQLRFGPCFATLKQIWASSERVFVLVSAPAALHPYIGDEPIHPVLLDCCTRVSAELLSLADAVQQEGILADGEGVFWAPWRIGAVSLSRRVPKEFYAYCDGAAHVGDDGLTNTRTILLLDKEGVCFGAIEAFTNRRAPRAAFLRALEGARLNNSYDVKWLTYVQPAAPIEADDVGTGATPPPDPIMLLSSDGTAIASSLAAALEASGREVIEIITDNPATEVTRIASADGFENVAGLVWFARGGVQVAPNAASVLPSHLLVFLQELQRRKPILPLGVTIVTHDAVLTGAGEACDPASASLWGLGRSIQNEAPDLKLRLIDVARASIETLARVVAAGGTESQIALRGSQIMVPRLERINLNRQLDPGTRRLVIAERGSFDGLRFETVTARAPGPGEVRLQVRAAGVNFRDVLNVLGAYPGDAGELGGEVSGEIIAVGEGVSHLTVGDRAFGLAVGGFASEITIPAALLRRLPQTLSHVGGATICVTFITAQAAFDLSGLSVGKRVLIHSGAGGVGMAAIQLAQSVGAEVFVTASASKQPMLREMGIGHVFDSRSTTFAREILAATDGAGVDVVLNSLTSEGFIAASLSCLRPGGHFVEIGKRDIWSPAEMAAQRPDVTYHILAIDDLIRVAPREIGALLDRLLPRLASGELQALSSRPFPLTEAAAAMRLMAGAGHVGKVVLTVDRTAIRSDASYLITGGLGALGLESASWLAEQGARHVVLVSRRRPDAASLERLRAIEEENGCRFVIESLDVANASAVAEFAVRFGAPEGDWPRLAGVIHAAGVLDDGLLQEQTPDRIAHVWNPKALGAWNLHEATQDIDLDFFVLYSSVAATLGSPGQSNYAAANAFLDGLAALRRSRGLAATSVAWGPWSCGMAEDPRVRSNLVRQGLRPLEPSEAHIALERLLRSGASGGVIVDADFARMGEILGDHRSPLLGGLVTAPAGSRKNDLMKRLRASAPDKRRDLLVSFLQGELQAVLGLASPSDPRTGFFDVGMDSLMALEFGSRLTKAFGSEVPLPNTLAFDYPSVEKLAGYFHDNIKFEAGAGADRSDPPADLEGSGREADDIARAVARARADIRHVIDTTNMDAGPQTTPRTVLLTGASGFLGCFLLNELIGHAQKVYCLVRCANEEEGLSILRSRMNRAELSFDERRVKVIPGDLTRENLGLTDKAMEELAQETDAILHCGAFVHHVHSYSTLEAANVGSTIALLRLAADRRKKKFIYVSTMSVPWSLDGVSHCSEAIVDNRPASSNGYVLTKWVSEQLVARYAEELGIPALIVRPGNITGSSISGYSNYESNQFWTWILTCLKMGAYPTLDMPIDLVPVDQVARAIAVLAMSPETELRVANLSSPEAVGFSQFCQLLAESGLAIKGESLEDWAGRLESIDVDDPVNLLGKFGGSTLYGMSLPVEQDGTLKAMRELGVTYSIDHRKLAKTYVSYMRRKGLV